MAEEGAAGTLLRLLEIVIPHLGAIPVVDYELGFSAYHFTLEVRVGNHGHKPFYVSEIWLCTPDRGQALSIYSEHKNPDVIVERGGKVYSRSLTLEDVEPYARSGSYVEMIEATGKKHVKALKHTSTEFMNGKWIRDRGLDKPVDNPASSES